jgi:hypothetical protein
MLLFFIFLFLVQQVNTDSSNYINHVFHVPDVHLLNFIVSPTNDSLFVVGVNRLFQLNATTLALHHQVNTGPQFDSPYCNYDGQCIEEPSKTSSSSSRESRRPVVNNSSKRLTDNWNKILHIFDNNKVLVCGSILQGVCQLYDVDDIRRAPIAVAVPVAANAANASTASVIGRDSTTGQLQLYVAASHTTDAYRDSFPSVSTRSLHMGNMLELVERDSILGESALHIRAEFKSQFRVNYVAALQHEHFVYWGATQPRDVSGAGANPFVSKLIRVCASDSR